MNPVNRMLDVLSFVPYFRGKGALVLTILRAFRNQTITARLPYGGRMVLGLDTLHQSLLPYWIGKYEPEVVHLFCKHLAQLPPNSDVIDVGANIGFYTVIAASALRSRGACVVHAFEPNPVVFAELESNIALNCFPNVRAHCAGVGDVEKQATLFVNASAITYSSLRPTHEFLTDEIPVPIVTLDRYAQTESLKRVGLIKLDVEGAELLALRGARYLLARDRPVLLYEEFERGYQEFGYAARDVRNFLLELDYRLYSMGAHKLHELSAPETHSEGASSYQNILAVPSNRT